MSTFFHPDLIPLAPPVQTEDEPHVWVGQQSQHTADCWWHWCSRRIQISKDEEEEWCYLMTRMRFFFPLGSWRDLRASAAVGWRWNSSTDPWDSKAFGGVWISTECCLLHQHPTSCLNIWCRHPDCCMCEETDVDKLQVRYSRYPLQYICEKGSTGWGLAWFSLQPSHFFSLSRFLS